MLAAGFLIIFAGYTVGSYGWILLKGYDITFREWVSPLNPYRWPSGAVPTISDTQIFPGPAAINAPAGPAGSQTYAQSVAGEGGNPIQQTGGTVAGRHGR